jgi:histone H3/H4
MSKRVINPKHSTQESRNDQNFDLLVKQSVRQKAIDLYGTKVAAERQSRLKSIENLSHCWTQSKPKTNSLWTPFKSNASQLTPNSVINRSLSQTLPKLRSDSKIETKLSKSLSQPKLLWAPLESRATQWASDRPSQQPIDYKSKSATNLSHTSNQSNAAPNRSTFDASVGSTEVFRNRSKSLSEVPKQIQSKTRSKSLSELIISSNDIKYPLIIIDKKYLQELVQKVVPDQRMDEEVEDFLVTIADDFIEKLITFSSMMAQNRNAKALDVKDVNLVLNKRWNMRFAEFGADNDPKGHKRSKTCEAHKKRMALLRKILKKG